MLGVCVSLSLFFCVYIWFVSWVFYLVLLLFFFRFILSLLYSFVVCCVFVCTETLYRTIFFCIYSRFAAWYFACTLSRSVTLVFSIRFDLAFRILYLILFYRAFSFRLKISAHTTFANQCEKEKEMIRSAKSRAICFFFLLSTAFVVAGARILWRTLIIHRICFYFLNECINGIWCQRLFIKLTVYKIEFSILKRQRQEKKIFFLLFIQTQIKVSIQPNIY